jgi:hypothetical protein
VTDERAQAERFADLFRAVYLTFHRRDGPRSQLPGASRAVLEQQTLDYMATMPAWKDHPRLTSSRPGS